MEDSYFVKVFINGECRGEFDYKSAVAYVEGYLSTYVKLSEEFGVLYELPSSIKFVTSKFVKEM